MADWFETVDTRLDRLEARAASHEAAAREQSEARHPSQYQFINEATGALHPASVEGHEHMPGLGWLTHEFAEWIREFRVDVRAFLAR